MRATIQCMLTQNFRISAYNVNPICVSRVRYVSSRNPLCFDLSKFPKAHEFVTHSGTRRNVNSRTLIYTERGTNILSGISRSVEKLARTFKSQQSSARPFIYLSTCLLQTTTHWQTSHRIDFAFQLINTKG